MPEIITRRNLPHWYRPGAAYFVTYRLAGTLPAAAMESLHQKRQAWLAERQPNQPEHERRIIAHKRWFAAYDALLHAASDVAWLRDARVAAVVRRNLYHHDGTKYHLHAYCIMPNHVHLVLQPIEPLVAGNERSDAYAVGERADGVSPLSRIMHSLKSYTAHEANQILQREGAFWQRECYDHWIRDDDELERIVWYIQANPVQAGLVARAEDWFWCSCHDRLLRDGEVTAWLG
jgi:putative DNA methylase